MQDFLGFPEPAGPRGLHDGPRVDEQKTQENSAPVREDRAVRSESTKPLWMKTHAPTRDVNATPEKGQPDTAVLVHGLPNHADQADQADQASNDAAFSRSALAIPAGPCGPAPHPWTDDRRWIGEIVRAEPGDPKMATLFWWVIAAGGWIEGTTAKLPALPSGMARNELRRMLRQHGLAVHEATS